jgi:hypothetical protein
LIDFICFNLIISSAFRISSFSINNICTQPNFYTILSMIYFCSESIFNWPILSLWSMTINSCDNLIFTSSLSNNKDLIQFYFHINHLYQAPNLVLNWNFR